MGVLPDRLWRKNLFIVWVSQFLAMMGFGCCMPFIPLLLRDNFGIVDEQIRGVYVSVYQLAGMTSLCIATAVWGMMADRFGRKLMLLRASYAAAIFYPLLAFMPNFTLLVTVRFLCSFFSGTVNPAQTMMVSCAPPEKHGFVLGVISTSIWSGHMAGYLLGGVVVHYYGYTAAFLCCSAIYALSGILVHLFTVEEFTPPAKCEKGANDQSASPVSLRGQITYPVVMIMLLFLFLGIARRIEEPFLAMLVEVVNGKEKAAFYVGIVSSLASVGGVLSGFWFGYLCDRMDPVKLALPLLAACAGTMIWQGLSTGIWGLTTARFFAYFVAGGVPPVLQVMLAKITSPELRGTSFGWAQSLNTAGGIICAFISGAVVYAAGVRSISITAGIIFVMMIPLYFMTRPAYRKALKEN